MSGSEPGEPRTAQAAASMDSECNYLVETRVIDGRKYILIPVEEDVEINGLPSSSRQKNKTNAMKKARRTVK